MFGSLAILCWGSLAALGQRLTHLPPFYILGVSFLLGALPALRKPRALFPGWKISLWGISGYFFYHFFLFYSFRFAPAIEANLINYLWPMLLVLMTPMFFPQYSLRSYHFVGAALSAIGCVFLVSGTELEFKVENLKGYLLALGAAITWPVYSIGKKKFKETQVWSVGGFCLGAGVLSLITHAIIEPRVVLQWRDAWVIGLMGLGPVGIAFYAWDKAMALGDSRVIGALSYLTPVLSTMGLVIFSHQQISSSTLIAMTLIIGGASTGVLDIFLSKPLNKAT